MLARGRSRGAGRARARGEGRGGGHRGRRLAPRRGRADRGAAEGALRPAGLRHRARARRHRHRLGPLDRRASISAARCGRRWREGLLLKGGGHAMAAGVTVRKDALAAFRAFLEETLGDAVAVARRERRAADRRRADGGGRDRELIATLARRAVRRRQSRAGLRAARPHARLCRRGRPGHVRVRLRSGDGAASTRSRSARWDKSSARRSLQNRGRTVHVAGCLAVDRWQGEERVQLRILDVAPADSFSGR